MALLSEVCEVAPTLVLVREPLIELCACGRCERGAIRVKGVGGIAAPLAAPAQLVPSKDKGNSDRSGINHRKCTPFPPLSSLRPESKAFRRASPNNLLCHMRITRINESYRVPLRSTTFSAALLLSWTCGSAGTEW